MERFLLFGLLLHTQPLNSLEQHTKADLEFSSDFGLLLALSGKNYILFLFCSVSNDATGTTTFINHMTEN